MQLLSRLPVFVVLGIVVVSCLVWRPLPQRLFAAALECAAGTAEGSCHVSLPLPQKRLASAPFAQAVGVTAVVHLDRVQGWPFCTFNWRNPCDAIKLQ